MDDPKDQIGRGIGEWHTIENLRLNVAEAMNGRTWLLLPESARLTPKTYPLPTVSEDLQKLLTIQIPHGRRDSGCIYLRRALKAWRSKGVAKRGLGAGKLDLEARRNRLAFSEWELKQHMKGIKYRANEAIVEVEKKAQEAIASLSDLFSLGRKGIEGQMQAHLAGQKWMSEDISAKDFRDCFRMVLQGVKGLGLPSEQRAAATDAVMQEIADSLKDTQETVALQPAADATETEH